MDTKKKTRKFNKGGFRLFLGVSPFLIIYFLFCYLPLEGWKYAFYDYRPGYLLKECNFVGLKHFSSMFLNPVLRREMIRVMTNTLAMSILGIVTSFMPMFFAIFLNEIPFKGLRKIIQTVTTIPNFISWVIVYALATALFAVESGAVNVVLMELGIIERGINFLASSKHVWLQMWLYSTWKGLGWSAVIYISGLSSIDQEMYEAAAVDGADRFQKIWYITVPGLMPTFVTLLILSIGNFLSTGMEQYYVFANSFNKSKIEVLDLYTYNVGLGTTNISYSTAVGMMKSIIGLILLFIANYISGKVRDEKIF